MKALNGFVFLVLATSPLAAHAHRPPPPPWPGPCLQEIVEKVSTSTQTTAKCIISESLATSWTRKEFPGLDAHEYPVEYWKGAFETHKIITTVYAHKIYDSCNGRFISTTNDTETEETVDTFKVRNPNLDDSIDATYKLVRMTREEALAEMKHQQRLCQAKP